MVRENSQELKRAQAPARSSRLRLSKSCMPRAARVSVWMGRLTPSTGLGRTSLMPSLPSSATFRSLSQGPHVKCSPANRLPGVPGAVEPPPRVTPRANQEHVT